MAAPNLGRTRMYGGRCDDMFSACARQHERMEWRARTKASRQANVRYAPRHPTCSIRNSVEGHPNCRRKTTSERQQGDRAPRLACRKFGPSVANAES